MSRVISVEVSWGRRSKNSQGYICACKISWGARFRAIVFVWTPRRFRRDKEVGGGGLTCLLGGDCGGAGVALLPGIRELPQGAKWRSCRAEWSEGGEICREDVSQVGRTMKGGPVGGTG